MTIVKCDSSATTTGARLTGAVLFVRLLALSVSLLAVPMHSATSATSFIEDSELALGGVSIGQPESAVLSMLGEPRRIVETGDHLAVRMEYTGLTVWLHGESRVEEILSTSADHCTPAGVCPGAASAAVIKTYGPPLTVDDSEGQYLEYTAAESACWLRFDLSGAVVQSVRVACQV
jgi:hypothetical protein